MRIVGVTGTELFLPGPLQVVRVEVEDWPGRLDITGDGVAGHADVHSGPLVEVGVSCTAPPGATVPIRVTATGGHTVEASLVVAEPGWTVWMVPHFHYDPVWWNTQAAYTATWDREGRLGTEFRAAFQHTGFDLVRLHLETARRDPDYKFVLAELDYLKPYWDSHPEDRRYLRTLLAEGRLELMGGTYNEPNTNLTSAESTIRNLVHGIGFQRDVIGGDPRTAWQLDVFGHDPQFPGLVADAGLDSSSWARGPFHQWGPMLWTYEPRDGWGDPSAMQFSSEFEWISPSGRGVLTHYMPAHYSAGWHIDAQPTLAGAQQSVYELFLLLKKVAATRNVLLPVGTDYTPPAKWVTEIHREWNSRYAWPRFVCALPREFFAAVRAQLAADGVPAAPQTRDMNPVYTGKDVSFIDTKQAQRHVEALLVDAELFATVAAALHGAQFPHAEVDKAWRQLVYGAHHDAITGSESDQVYLDLLTGWREAHDLAGSVLDGALDRLGPRPGGGPDRSVVVFNPSAWPRTDLVRVRVDLPHPGTTGLTVGDLPVQLEHPRRHEDGTLASVDVVFRATDVPSLGYRAFPLMLSSAPVSAPAFAPVSAPAFAPVSAPAFAPVSAPAFGWTATGGEPVIANDVYRLTVDPARGGCVSSLVDLRTGRELLRPGRVGNELLVYDEYSAHPRFHEGPWHLLPKGPATHGSAREPATGVLVEHGPLGERITVTGAAGPLRFTQTLTLWPGDERLDLTTRVDDFTGEDHLVRLCWPVDVPGGLPVSEVGNAVVGRGFGLVEVDSEQAPWTLDNPAQHWFAVSSTARVDVHDLSGARRHTRAIGIAEIVAAQDVRDLAVALVRRGVTATTSRPGGPRYGRLAVDSNLPDVRISVGRTPFTEAVLAAADPSYAGEIDRQLAVAGRARVLVPAARPLTDVWVPNADLTGVLDLPVLIVIGAGAVETLCDDLATTGTVPVAQPATIMPDPDLDDRTVAIVNRGIPGFAVDTTGALHLSLLRSCTGWPSGVWIDPPRRTAPDGSTFQQQHWTHTFDAALVAGPGDWRATALVRHGHEVNHSLHARVIPGSSTESASYLTVSTTGDVVVTALKPSGNPLAVGIPPATVNNVTVRLYEAAGSPTDARLALWTPVTDAHATNLLESPADPLPVRDGAVLLSLDGASIAQITAGTGPITPTPAPAAPAYAKYWLHNTGPAPTGNLPVTVHLDPPVATIPSVTPAPPDVPATPALPATPTMPATPAPPATLTMPATPAPPTTLTMPATSDATAIPTTPKAPATSATPAVPATSAAPATSAVPATSAAPEELATPAVPALENPTTPATPTPSDAAVTPAPLATVVTPATDVVGVGGGAVAVTVTVASDLTRDRSTGTVSLDVPPGFVAEPGGFAFDLPPGGFVQHRVTIHPPLDFRQGVYWLRARTSHGVEDFVRLLAGVDKPETVTATWSDPGPLRLRPGQSSQLELSLDTDAAGPIVVDVELISPWHTWDVFPAPSHRVDLSGRTTLRIPVTVPDGHGPGTWWALCKVAHAGELHYTAPVTVTVLP
ncbi:glycoside hydrolase family 38 C-terminal domain-containing protein [Dactylosporangium sp. NPDC050588]|uniref:glycoside hydrolase family 38 N-terminal domain-containing protein n=1 Tax=Dactylosporangium sp. NPDC050588 TaxID=3157211 RepID=UPI0033CAE892